MDLFATDQLDATRWRLAKLVAFVCFGIACCLLGASLVLSEPYGVEATTSQPHAAATPAN